MIPITASTGSDVKPEAIRAMSEHEVAAISPMLSANTALTATESIRLPIERLKSASQSFAAMDTARVTAAGTLNTVGSGFVNLSTEPLISSTPVIRIKKASVSAETYSTRPWPKGCSLSAGLPDILKPIRLMMDETASKRLLTPSATTAILCAAEPNISLKRDSKAFSAMPTAPLSTP